MSKFTPGPWALETVKTSSGICHKIGPFPPRTGGTHQRHACLYADFPSQFDPADAELAANAALIADAPALLDALERLVKDMPAALDYEDALVSEARALIAKHRGGV